MSYDLRFVDSISATPSVRLDLMAAPWAVQSSTDFGMPELRRATAGTLLVDGEQYPAAAYGNRAITLVARVRDVAEDETAAALQALYRELNRASNLLEYRPATSAPVFFRTFRAAPDSVVWDPFVREVRAVIPAEPFAYGLKETIGGTLNADSSFEAGAGGWTGLVASVAQSPTVARTGTYSLRITPVTGGGVQGARSELVPVTAGLPYVGSAWLYSTAGWASGASMVLDWCDSGGTVLSSTFGTAVAIPVASWTRYQAAGVVPAGATHVQIRPRIAGSPTSADLVYVDDATVGQYLTVSNDPAAAINGCCFDVRNIKGDVETPLFLRLDQDVIGSVYDYRNVVMGVRRRGTPAQAPFVLQAEAMTTGTNTTLGAATDPLMSGSGQNYMRIAPAGALMEQRLYMPLWPTAATPDVRGRYRVLARMRISAVTDVWSVQFAYGANATVPIRNEAVRVTQTSEIAYYDLGTIQAPVGSDPVADGYSGTETPVAGTRIAVWAQRAAGTGSLDVDCLVFVPADDRYSVTRVWSDTGASAGIIDGAQHMAYAVGGSGEVRMPAQPDAPVGGLPMLSPGTTNRIVWLVDGGSPRDILSSTSTLTPYYWPRYLYTRPPSS
ncbi:hypothetical protein ABZ793_12240 [Micromonospora sp. NPDC047465]|uniref:hypothetical protein n=1 Tax=Micromonospora sp. NPDC047465 TaxID=3154813 RepID=UPI0033DEF5DA